MQNYERNTNSIMSPSCLRDFYTILFKLKYLKYSLFNPRTKVEVETRQDKFARQNSCYPFTLRYTSNFCRMCTFFRIIWCKVARFSIARQKAGFKLVSGQINYVILGKSRRRKPMNVIQTLLIFRILPITENKEINSHYYGFYTPL